MPFHTALLHGEFQERSLGFITQIMRFSLRNLRLHLVFAIFLPPGCATLAAAVNLYPLKPKRHCRLWRKLPVRPKDCAELGKISGQFLGRKTAGQEPTNALVEEGRLSHAAG